METPLTVHPLPEDESPRTKPTPQVRAPLDSAYLPSDDGTDENLLILFHGLGGTHLPFLNLGRRLRLPQTATLSVRAPERVPYLEEEAYQWYESFTPLGDLLTNPNPTKTLELLQKLLEHLVDDIKWPANKIHLFGFGQGGSIASELGLRWWRCRGGDANKLHHRLGSIVSIAGPLLSYPTSKLSCTTPVLVFHRPQSEQTRVSASDLTAFKRGYGESIQECKVETRSDGMPSSKEEWEPIMRFWSSFLSRRNESGLYQVL